jgi:hypothetical protein
MRDDQRSAAGICGMEPLQLCPLRVPKQEGSLTDVALL